MMAATCFWRAACTRYPNAGRALRDIGREYLAKPGRVALARQTPRPAQCRALLSSTSIRAPWRISK
jgi:hypothetical protein